MLPNQDRLESESFEPEQIDVAVVDLQVEYEDDWHDKKPLMASQAMMARLLYAYQTDI